MSSVELPRGASADLERGSVFFVGNATVILRYAGFTVLTDPNFLHRGEIAHLGYGLKTQRLTEPALQLDELPPLDLVVLSHMHEDHFDRRVAERLDRGTRLCTTPHASVLLERRGFSTVHSLHTWSKLELRKGEAELRVTAMPARHGPALLSLALPPTMGSLLELGPRGGEPTFRVYVTGDTLVHDRLYEIRRRHPAIDLALLHLGGTRVLGVMVTMDGEQGVETMQIVHPEAAIPIHYDDYSRFTSPLDDFKSAVEEAGLEEKVRYLARGETYTFEVPRCRLELAAQAPTAAELRERT